MEHIIVEMPEVLHARSIEGSIGGPHGDALPDVSFEIRDDTGKVRAAISDSRGRFSIRGVTKGTYRFKATKDGFQSIVGTVVVDKGAPNNSKISLQLPVGV